MAPAAVVERGRIIKHEETVRFKGNVNLIATELKPKQTIRYIRVDTQEAYEALKPLVEKETPVKSITGDTDGKVTAGFGGKLEPFEKRPMILKFSAYQSTQVP